MSFSHFGLHFLVNMNLVKSSLSVPYHTIPFMDDGGVGVGGAAVVFVLFCLDHPIFIFRICLCYISGKFSHFSALYICIEGKH